MSEEDKKVVVYIGKDQTFLKHLRTEFNKLYGGMAFEYESLYEEDVSKIQSLFPKIAYLKAKMVFIDFSAQTEDHLHLARLIKRTNSTRSITTVGILDYLAPPDLISEAVFTGVKLNHIKGAEIHDVVFDAMTLAYPENVREHGFATASLSDVIHLYEPVKINWVQEGLIHLESHRKFPIKNKISLECFLKEKKIVPSRLFEVVDCFQSEIFYNFNYALECSPVYIDPIERDSEEDAKIRKDKELDREVELADAKISYKEWLRDNLELSSPKFVKILAIDNYLTLFQSEKRTDQFSYVIRGQPYLDEIHDEVSRTLPQVIVYQMDNVGKTQKEEVSVNPHVELQILAPPGKQNDLSTLQKILNSVKGHDDYHPVVFVFNCENWTSEDLQNKCNYPKILIYNDYLSFEIFQKICKKFEEGASKRIAESKKDNSKLRVYFKKENPLSKAGLVLDIKLRNLSETELTFITEENVDLYSCFKVDFPVSMYLTVVPHSEASLQKGGKESHRALINGIGEEEKKELRKFINSVFFRDLDAQKLQELEEVKKVNREAYKAKVEQLRLEMEAKAAEEIAKEDEKKAKEREKIKKEEDNGSPTESSEEEMP